MNALAFVQMMERIKSRKRLETATRRLFFCRSTPRRKERDGERERERRCWLIVVFSLSLFFLFLLWRYYKSALTEQDSGGALFFGGWYTAHLSERLKYTRVPRPPTPATLPVWRRNKQALLSLSLSLSLFSFEATQSARPHQTFSSFCSSRAINHSSGLRLQVKPN